MASACGTQIEPTEPRHARASPPPDWRAAVCTRSLDQTARTCVAHEVTLRYLTLYYITFHYVTLRYITCVRRGGSPHYVIHYATLESGSLLALVGPDLAHLCADTLRCIVSHYAKSRNIHNLRNIIYGVAWLDVVAMSLRRVTFRCIKLRCIVLQYVILCYITSH